jgi:oxygen-independent coproporphyrinogen-3 oxidase
VAVTVEGESAAVNLRPGPQDSLRFAWPIPQSAYIHVPFCRHRCGYCHFSVLPGRLDLAEPYLDALATELARLGSPTSVRTLFIGGGTPTRLPPPQLDRLFDLLDQWLPLADGGELSVEANPEDISFALLRQLADRGVNRISLGVQSFAAPKLRMLQRGHDHRVASAAIEAAAQEIGNVSIDLIFAAPGETPEAWRADLATAVALPISHLSTYSLTYEKGTEFWGRRFKGELAAIDEEDEVRMYRDARRIAEAAGLGHYEISNFARAGARCAHNLAYWQGLGWLAMGPGAARFVAGCREVNHRSPTTYIRRLQQGQSPVAESEPITPTQWACERAAFGIRMLDGIDLEGIRRETGVCVATLRGPEIQRCLQHGWLTVTGTHYRLTEAGLLMADGVAAAFL